MQPAVFRVRRRKPLERNQSAPYVFSGVFPFRERGRGASCMERLSLCIGNLGRGWSCEMWSSWVTPNVVCVCGRCSDEFGGKATLDGPGCSANVAGEGLVGERRRRKQGRLTSRPQDHRHGCTSPRTGRRRFSPPSPFPSAWYHYA